MKISVAAKELKELKELRAECRPATCEPVICDPNPTRSYPFSPSLYMYLIAGL